MREAAAALAETENVLKTRKEALIARHVEGRESLQDLDHIFSANERSVKDSNAVGGFKNYLDRHAGELDHYKKLVDESE